MFTELKRSFIEMLESKKETRRIEEQCQRDIEESDRQLAIHRQKVEQVINDLRANRSHMRVAHVERIREIDEWAEKRKLDISSVLNRV